MVSVTLVGYQPNFQPISFVRVIRDSTGKNLDEAKEILDRFVEGKPCTIDFISPQTAGEFVTRAKNIGVIVRGYEVRAGGISPSGG